MKRKVLNAAKLLVILAVMLCSCVSEQSYEPVHSKIYVTVIDGDIKLACAEIDVTEMVGNTPLDVMSALYLAHDEYFPGGSKEGFSFALGEDGLVLRRLWGVSDASLGCYVNNKPVRTLSDYVKNGDHIIAFVCSDGGAGSDLYTYFDKSRVELAANAPKTVTLTLYAAPCDENGKTAEVPISGASITFNGNPTPYVTDSEGKVVLEINGDTVISATVGTVDIIAPVCAVKIFG